jgi:predicted MPP superfamily phosphohydrolase
LLAAIRLSPFLYRCLDLVKPLSGNFVGSARALFRAKPRRGIDTGRTVFVQSAVTSFLSSGAAFRAAAAATLTAAGIAGYALGVEPYRLRVVRVCIELPRLPRALDGLSVLLLADLHTEAWGRREHALSRILDALGTPDLTLLAGDLLQGARGLVPVCELIERHVRARHATYAIWGNAEHKPRQATRDAFRARLERAGVRVLVNENETLTLRDGQTITVAGTDDPYYGHADLPRTLAGWDPARFCLLLAHSPQIATQAFRSGVDLMVSGHTHGGRCGCRSSAR